MVKATLATSSELLATLDAYHKHLDRKPADWNIRLVLADLYAELGDEREVVQRWMAKHSRAPGTLGGHLWAWVKSGTDGLPRGTFWTLDHELFRHLPHGVELAWERDNYRDYGSRQVAEDGLLAGLRVVYPELFATAQGE